MQVNEFIRLREQDWQQLEQFVNRHRGRVPLSAQEVHSLNRLYRAVTSDLALARRDYPDQPVTLFLNQLLTRAHSYIYQEDITDLNRLVTYFTRHIPQVFRQSLPFILTAFVLFFVSALIGFRLLSVNPQAAEVLGLEEQRAILADQETWTDIPVNARPYASAFIMSNNIRVALMAFAGGVGFGLFTLYILIFNGLVIGGVLGLAAHYGMADTLVAFIVGHGVIELSIIFIAGGAGLALGWSLLNPGDYTRRDALAQTAQRIVPLGVLTIPMLIIAGLIEGFISPTNTPLYVRAAVGIGSGLLMYGYLYWGGRRRTERAT